MTESSSLPNDQGREPVSLKNIVSNSRLAQARCSNITESVATSAGSSNRVHVDGSNDRPMFGIVTHHRNLIGFGQVDWQK